VIRSPLALRFFLAIFFFGALRAESKPFDSIHASYGLTFPDFKSDDRVQSLRMGAQIRPGLRMGAGAHYWSKWGTLTTGDWSDPYLFADLPGGIETESWNVFTSLLMSIPTTRSSQEHLRITSLTLSQSWFRKTTASPWQWGFEFLLNPTFYNDPIPEGLPNRQTLYGSAGFALIYRFSDHFLIASRTTLQMEHRDPMPTGAPLFQSPFPETQRFSAVVTPFLRDWDCSISTTLQMPLFQPEWDSSTLSASLAIGF
jgi:hypothetical protein